MKLADYLRTLDERERAALATRAGTTYLHLRNVAFSGKSCGIPLAVGIERETAGAVRRWTLRPNDWHLIWPEIVTAEGAPPTPSKEVADAA